MCVSSLVRWGKIETTFYCDLKHACCIHPIHQMTTEHW